MIFSSISAFASEFGSSRASRIGSETADDITYASEQPDYDEQEYLKSKSSMRSGGVMSGDNGETKYPQLKYQPIGEERERYLQEKMMEQRRKAAADEYKRLAVPVHEQINGYYCGPATVQQVVEFITGDDSYSQEEIADMLGTTRNGTDMTVIPGVVNDLCDFNWYVLSDIGNTFDYWFNQVTYSIDEEKPAILDIDTQEVDAFPYDSSGHFVNVSGYDVYDLAGIHRTRITDPYWKGLGNVWYDSEDVYHANDDHFRRSIIW